MTTDTINYSQFIKDVYQSFASKASLEEIKEILDLEEDYNRDSPSSLGKFLVLNRLIFSGKKNSGEKISFDQNFHKGINVWIADNHKGKSTIFKIIKFALTGADKIKPDIKPWIEEILLEFSIGKDIYTIRIDRTGRDKGAMYSFDIEKIIEFKKNQKLDTLEKEFEFKFNSHFEKNIQEFFFEHFSFYTLKYTQKNSSKDKIGLNSKDSELTWTTYFKSIYLESSNYEHLFFDKEYMGGQGKKIFEMILGLPLTYPINMLGVRLDRVLEEIGKLKLVDSSKSESKKSAKELLEKRHIEVTKNLNEIKLNSKIDFNEKTLLEEYNNIRDKINEIQKQSRIINENYQNEKNKLISLEEEIKNLEEDKKKTETEINKLKKQELGLDLYHNAEGFFSNLEIKVCPHCDVEVDAKKKEKERKNHVCSLCGETSTHQKIDKKEIQEKLTDIKEEQSLYKVRLESLQKNIKTQQNNSVKLKESLQKINLQLNAIPSTKVEDGRLIAIESEIESINKERKKYKDLIERKEDLIKEEAVLTFQLTEIEKYKTSESVEEIRRFELKKDILEYAIKSLEASRLLLNQDIMTKLEKLILNEIHAFGLSNINKIEINDKYDLIFTQNEVKEKFNELNEGEKLRVKLAFYLSIIQLDIEYKLGRHPRFLIFDSPGNEEMIEEHLNGLSKILKNVNDRFKDQLQIFIGSALHEFSEITEPEKTLIKEKDEFLF